MEPTLQALGQSLEHWQALYIVALILAVLSTISIVLFNFHLRNVKHGLRFSNYIYALAAGLSVVATLVIITKTRAIDAEKDREVKIAAGVADLKIAQADKDAGKAIFDAAIANQKAEEAKLKAQEIERANAKLKIDLVMHETREKDAESKLAAQNQQTAQFVQGVAQQQQGMAQQMQATPSLGDAQVDIIAALLKPFAGKAVSIHVMLDARSSRLGGRFQQAFSKAGIRIEVFSTDVGPNYVGVMVLVKRPTPEPHPLLADALRNAIQSIGIQPHTFADPSLKDDEVRLCIGPE